jgi:hypothetical protein
VKGGSMNINSGEMLFGTVEKYNEYIAIYESAIARQGMIGASSMNNSGGSQRAMTEVEFNNMVQFLARLRKELSYLTGSTNDANVLIVQPGW